MLKTDTLIRTKLRRPFIRPSLVPRLRLQERIASGLQGPLTLVIASAGFGKTTLVASCVVDCGMPVAWLSLDKDDNQSGRFLTYLIAALQGADHRIGAEASQLIMGMQPAPLEAVLTSLINDLDATDGERVLVLDDYQYISNPTVHTEVAFLLEHCPHTFHLLIATRSDPPLPLARLRARGQMVELRTADLRFTADEAGQFLNDVMGLHIDIESVLALEERTEGWVAGLQMAALSMRNPKDVRGFIEGFSGTNRHILDYLMEEILAGQSPEIQRFLLCTSILERVMAPLCDAVLENDEGSKRKGADRSMGSGSLFLRQSASILNYLERSNLFLVPLDDERQWYRYHQLFADLLRARLQLTQPDLVSILHIRASTWLEKKGFIPEAIQHLFAAHEIGRAADLIEPYGATRWAVSDPSVVQMADSLPREILLDRPKLGLYLAWLLICQGQIERAVPLLTALAQHLTIAVSDPGLRWIQSMVALALAFLSPSLCPPGFDPLPDPQVLDTIPAEELILRDAADILYGMLLERRGEIDRAAEVAVRCIQRNKISHGTLAPPTIISFLAVIYLMQGRLHAAASLCREYVDPIKQSGIRLISTAGNMNVVLGVVLYEWNHLEEAEQLIRDSLQANESWHNIMTDSLGLLALARVLQAKEDYAGAMQVVERFETRLQTHLRPVEFAADFCTLRVRVQLASGDLHNASHWADQVSLSEDFHLHPEYYRLSLARIRLVQNRYADVVEIVEEMLAGTPSPSGYGDRITRQIEPNLLLAAALAGQRRFPEAFGFIETCLALAEPEGYVRIFLDVGEPVRDLLAAYLRSDAPAHKLYARKVLDAFSHVSEAESPRPQPSGLVEPLSERELEVLHLMALGKTNEEIARQLVVVRGTIKAHAASIYRKLDVANRTEAVARARQLGILP
jgi:LuxR family transcriptional regulator, maltose regulon positive regulatory protein